MLGQTEVLLIARALYAYNSYPGRKISDVTWPPSVRSAEKSYLNKAQAVAEVLNAWEVEQRDAVCTVDVSRAPTVAALLEMKD